MEHKIVVVDDDVKVVILLEKVLKKLGFEVFSADDGNKALELVKKERPDLLISDMLIPGLHGIELSKTIKQDPELKDTIVVLMTAVYGKREYTSNDMDSMADKYIDKPIDVKNLINLISSLKDWS
jgi:CheY-like chemotaxis protein